MASADFCRPFGPPCDGPSHGQDGRSLRVRRVTFLPYTRRIYAAKVRMTSGFESICPLAHRFDASYAIHVLRARSLPAASFGLRLAADALAFRLGVPVIKVSTGTFARPVTSRFAFAPRLTASGMTLRVMPDAQTKRPTWRNTHRYSTTSAYSLTSPPEWSGCSPSSHPTTSLAKPHSLTLRLSHRSNHTRPGGKGNRIPCFFSEVAILLPVLALETDW